MKFEAEKLLLNVLVLVVILQIGSILTNKLFGFQTIKLGMAILLIILASIMAVVVNASFGYKSGLKGTDILHIGFLIGIGVAIYYYAPKYFPEIFSIFKTGIFSSITP